MLNKMSDAMFHAWLGYSLLLFIGYLLWQFDWKPKFVMPFVFVAGFCFQCIMLTIFPFDGATPQLWHNGSFTPNNDAYWVVLLSTWFAGLMVLLYLIGRFFVRRWLRR